MRPINDMDLLLSSFRARLNAALEDLREQGYWPRVHETWRSQQRQQELRRRGVTRTLRSMHMLGLAADVVCAEHWWGCKGKGCDFFRALGKAVKRQGLCWGGGMFPVNRLTGRRFRDLPHVQAVSYFEQRAARIARDRNHFAAECIRKRKKRRGH